MLWNMRTMASGYLLLGPLGGLLLGPPLPLNLGSSQTSLFHIRMGRAFPDIFDKDEMLHSYMATADMVCFYPVALPCLVRGTSRGLRGDISLSNIRLAEHNPHSA